MQIIDDYNKINIDNHAIIEASAGTGKTFTIENLVIKILLKKKALPSEIIIVTFTEKATGELKEKIRKNLEGRLNKTDENGSVIIKEILENFENLFISTIHGFCNNLIKEYFFECRSNLNNELVDDYDLIELLLHKQMRNDWKYFYEDYLNKIIEFSDFVDKPQNFEKIVLDLILKYKPYCGNKINPEPKALDEIKNEIDNFEKKIKTLFSLINKVDENDIESNEIYNEYKNLDKILHKASITARLTNIIKPLLLYKIQYTDNDSIITGFKSFYNQSKECSGFNEKGYNVLFAGKIKKGSEDYNIENRHDNLLKMINLLEEISNDYLSINKQLLSNTVNRLFTDLIEYKQENGLISYDDMLRIINDSIINNKNLLSILQKRYKYALVDEFQDTDKIQWNIFKNIFFNHPKNKLFIIGDPKQSIYGFRNADISTYMEAKNIFLKKNNANHYVLDTNWRSTNTLIDDLNSFFTNTEWFQNDITYTKIKPPSLNYIEEKINIKERNNGGIFFFEIEQANAIQKLKKLNELIYKEITFLMTNKENFIIKPKNQPERPINQCDICIIVRKKNEARIIQEYLISKGIKTTIYKKTGLYQSKEALHLKYLLTAICYPADQMAFKKALLTDFFKINLNNINNYIDIDNTNQIKVLINKWTILAENKSWTNLFDSIFYETGLFYRTVYEEKELNIDSERIITNYRHIAENLQNIGHKKRFDIFELLNHLNNLINNNISTQEEEDLHRLETEQDKIKIMTIHASKGLEFPIVFIYTNFSKKNTYDYYKFHDNDNNTVYDLVKENENEKTHLLEESLENERLFYVAFTRAINKLYIPCFNQKDITKVIDICPKIKNTFDNLKPDKNKLINIDFYNNIYQEQPKLHFTDSINTPKLELQDNIELFPEINKNIFINRKITIQSFSYLNKKINFEIPDEIYKHDYEEIKKDMDENINKKYNMLQEEDKDIPSTTYVGLMFHKILEEIDFSIIKEINNFKDIMKNEQISELINKYFDLYLERNINNLDNELKNIYKIKIANIIYNTLKVPINDKDLILSDLDNNDKLHEIEFYYDVKTKLKKSEILMNGIMDMIFRFKNRYYLLDWKSNHLDNYSGEFFKNQVKNHYELQYQIYNIALINWLKTRINNFDYDKHFGGVFYLYLRGIGFDDQNQSNGIFFIRPSFKDYQIIENNVSKLIESHLSTTC